MKTPKFLLCESPTGEHDRVFILHLRSPVIIAEIIDCTGMDADRIAAKMASITIGGYLEYSPEHFIFEAVYIDPASSAHNELPGIMRRMADWYKSYLIFEDSNV